MATCGAAQPSDCDDCVQVVRDTKRVQVPCTRNTYQKYTVNVPRQVTEQVPRTVTYTDYESRSKQVPYTVNRPERRTRMQTERYQVPVTKYYKRVVMETRERQVPVPVFVNIPETEYRNATGQGPVQNTNVQLDQRVPLSGSGTQTGTLSIPETKIVAKPIPVYDVNPKPAPYNVNPKPAPYNVNPKPAPPSQPQVGSGGMGNDVDYMVGKNVRDFNAIDSNKDGVISFNEFSAARAAGNTVGPNHVPPLSENVRDFNAIGTNKDGAISYNEFAAARASGNPVVGNPVPTQSENVRDFNAIDTNKDDAISFNEFAEARAAGSPVVGNHVPMQTQKYQVPVTKYYKRVDMVTRERQVPVPYYVNVPETKYRTVTEQVPVQKTKVQMDERVRTVVDTQTRTRCVPVTKMVTKEIPVYNVVSKPAPPCPPQTDCGGMGNDGNPGPTYVE